ncbi:hypothetical protein MANES_05G124300v8 [Manihot esculenta]|uniref:Uncharacterized protein n=1 Tax=Manihot esculenta TaxID=3983 RepID=A0ACB7HQV7_MANES|nr:hypothetical protein MANES_05G124300v8 [Manihot esculenta]
MYSVYCFFHCLFVCVASFLVLCVFKSQTQACLVSVECPEIIVRQRGEKGRENSRNPRKKKVEMEEEEQYKNGVLGGGLGVKVMTDEQMEMLRKQISVYATICESLVQLHKTISAQQDFAGMRSANLYSDPFLSYAFHKVPSRQRWAPKPAQLEILESMFEQSNTTPDRQRIREITIQLAEHGPISETNVYNWFQNRRARSKRKQAALPPIPNHHDSAKDKETKPDETQVDENLAIMLNHMYFQSPDIGGGAT